MGSSKLSLLAIRASIIPTSLSKAQILLVILMCTPILVTIIFMAGWYYQARAKQRAEDDVTEEILRRSRAQTAAYQAHTLATLEIESDRIRTLAILEGLVMERAVTDRSGRG